MKKNLVIALAVVTVISVPFTVFAAASGTQVAQNIRSFLHIDLTKLNPTQKADVDSYAQKMANLQIEYINKMIANGSITAADGKARIDKINEDLKNGKGQNLLPGFGNGGERGFKGPGGKGFGGPGMSKGFGLYGVDPTKLSDIQKADIIASLKSQANLQKTLITKLVKDGPLSADQGTAASKKVDEWISNLDKNGLGNGFGKMMGLPFLGMEGVDFSKLTDPQKADITDYQTQCTALQKDLINKMVASKALTTDQATAANKMLDEMAKNQNANGYMKGFGGQGKGGFRGKGGHFGGKATSTGVTVTGQNGQGV
jgi:polyhydroxyalkanoate synthesis regulator phasin